ncbi:Sporulation kinase E [compost metagenome]
MDDAQIKQVLINTIQNAIEACEGEDSHVTLKCSLENSRCHIIIEDNGCGMDEETQKQIMTPFYTTKETGTGLGMAVSYRIIESHDGGISVTSKKGIGTKVNIMIPC